MNKEEAKDFLTHYICSCPYGTSPADCNDEKCQFGMSVRTLCREEPITSSKELKSIKSEDYRRAFTEVICGDCQYVDVPRNRKPCCSCSWLERKSYYEEAEKNE